MNDINIGHIIAWVLIGALIVGYLAWHFTHDLRTKKRARAIKMTAKPQFVNVVDIKMGRYSVDAFILEYATADGSTAQERFVPRSLPTELDMLSIREGEQGQLFTQKIHAGEPAWLDVREYSFWGYLGPRIG